MFRFEGFIDDKHVVQLLRFVPTIKATEFLCVPVLNAGRKGSGIIVKNDGSATQIVWDIISKQDTATTKQIKDILTTNGFAKGSVGHVRNGLVADKRIKLVSRGQYKIMKRAA